MKLLDTSALIEIDRGAPEKVEKLDEEGKHTISQVTVTEMFLGIEYGYERNTQEYREAREKLERLLSRFKIIQIDRAIAIKAAEMIADLKQKGRPIDDLHDIYIAATGVIEDLLILTTNPKHFQPIKGLEIQEWEKY